MVYAAILFFYVVLWAVPKTYEHKDQQLKWTNDLAVSLAVQNSNQTSLVSTQRNTIDFLTRETNRLAGEVIRQENPQTASQIQKMAEAYNQAMNKVVDVASTNQALRPLLADLASPPPSPQTTNVTFQTLDEADAELKASRRRKQAAAAEQSYRKADEDRKAMQATGAAWSNCSPTFDVIIKAFEENLRIHARKYGDRVISTNEKLPPILNTTIGDYASIGLMTNKTWTFSVLLQGQGSSYQADIRNMRTSGLPSLIVEMTYKGMEDKMSLQIHELSGPHGREAVKFQHAPAYAARLFGEFFALQNEQFPITNAMPQK